MKMRLLTKCCFKINLKSGTIMLLSMYWLLSVTYLVLLLQYFSDHKILVSMLIGMIFIIWFCCAVVGLYGVVNKKNAYYLIPQIVIDIIDCFTHLINLVYRLFSHNLLIPRFTVFGMNKRIVEDAKADVTFVQMIYNLFDERYPLPNLFAFFDLCVRVYFLLVFISYVLEFRNRSMKKSARKTAKKGNKSGRRMSRSTKRPSALTKSPSALTISNAPK